MELLPYVIITIHLDGIGIHKPFAIDGNRNSSHSACYSHIALEAGHLEESTTRLNDVVLVVVASLASARGLALVAALAPSAPGWMAAPAAAAGRRAVS